MKTIVTTGRFRLGRVVITPGALNELSPEDVLCFLCRHLNGDWGDVCQEDQWANDLALEEGHRLFSSYRTENGTKFWVITEHDRSVTTFLLPEEY
tara:strand:+ start:20874 stop:21158 length:285 start_codon:yes stop_codon:yes gene_type:complete